MRGEWGVFNGRCSFRPVAGQLQSIWAVRFFLYECLHCTHTQFHKELTSPNRLCQNKFNKTWLVCVLNSVIYDQRTMKRKKSSKHCLIHAVEEICPETESMSHQTLSSSLICSFFSLNSQVLKEKVKISSGMHLDSIAQGCMQTHKAIAWMPCFTVEGGCTVESPAWVSKCQ